MSTFYEYVSGCSPDNFSIFEIIKWIKIKLNEKTIIELTKNQLVVTLNCLKYNKGRRFDTIGKQEVKMPIPWFNFDNKKYSVNSDLGEDNEFVIEILYDQTTVDVSKGIIKYPKTVSANSLRTQTILIDDFIKIDGHYLPENIERPFVKILNTIQVFEFTLSKSVDLLYWEENFNVPFEEGTVVKRLEVYSPAFKVLKVEVEMCGHSVKCENNAHSMKYDIQNSLFKQIVFTNGNSTFHSGLNIKKNAKIIVKCSFAKKIGAFENINAPIPASDLNIEIYCVTTLMVNY